MQQFKLSNLTRLSIYWVIFMVLLAACSPAAPTPRTRFSFNLRTPTPVIPPTETPVPPATPTPDLTVLVGTANGTGSFLVDGRGMTLYIFRKDTPGAGSSAPVAWGCTSGCGANWPPMVASAASPLLAGPGVTGMLGIFTRPDGIRQVTYNGWPLYYFAGDKNPGDVNGDGIGNLWAVAPVNISTLALAGFVPLTGGVSPLLGEPSPAPSNNPSIVIGGNPQLGDFLVDARYRTLYVFRGDYPGASHCYDQCAVNWPPYTIQQGSPTIEAGLTGLVGVITRPDGTRQITVNDWPLYYFAGDVKPGNANGDGVNNNWYVISLDGFPEEPDSSRYKIGGADGY